MSATEKSGGEITAGDILLEARNLTKHYPVRNGLFARGGQTVKSVDGVSLAIRRGETLGLVGESGCGKTTLGKLLLRLTEATGGEVLFEGKNLLKLGKRELRALRKDIQIVYQDPYSSFNPKFNVGEIIAEPLKIQGGFSAAERTARVKELLEITGLSPEHADRYPHEFSGGQRQRIGIARALVLNPKLIVFDEAVSALDVSTQAQILNMLDDIQRRFGLTYLFIAHGLAAVRHIADRVAVMYLGKIVELADSGTLYGSPRHPYTQALFSAIPVSDPEANRERILLEGDVPSPVNPPAGCRFHTRCPWADAECARREPKLTNIGDGRFAACLKLEGWS